MQLLALLCLAGLGCNGAKPEPTARETALVVFAAASLREALTAIGDDFERARPGVEVTFNFAGTQELRTQIEHGAAADVLASADQKHMGVLLKASRVSEPVVFARNELVAVVSKESAGTITSLQELPNADRIVIGAPEVPVGRYTLELLDRASTPTALGADYRARVEAKIVSRELNVRQVLAKVSLGEAQVGFVYRTDALAVQGKVDVLSIPSDLNVIATYPIAVVTGAPQPELARAFVDFVLSSEGQDALRTAGFLSPAP